MDSGAHLDGCWWLGGNVEHDPVDALHLVGDAVGDRGEEVVWEGEPVRIEWTSGCSVTVA